jgi:hypothetical protein
MSLKRVLRDVRSCRICEAQLPLGPRPVVQLASTARLLIMRAEVARTLIQASSRSRADAFGGSIRASVLPKSGAEDIHDRDREDVFTIPSPIVSAAAP